MGGRGLFGGSGRLGHIEAVQPEATLLIAHLVVMALFFLIEILPVTVKVLLNLQPPTAYEVVAQARDDDLIERVRAGQTEARRIEEGRTRARLAVEDDMRQREVAAGKGATSTWRPS